MFLGRSPYINISMDGSDGIYNDQQYEYLCILPSGKTFCFETESHTFQLVASDGEEKLASFNSSRYLHYENRSSNNSGTERISYADLSKRLQFEYIGHVQYESSRDLHQMVYSISDDMREKGQYDNESICKMIRQGIVSENLVVKHIGFIDGVDVGHGLFALRNINSDTFLGEYTGIISSSTLGAGQTNYCCHYPSCDGGTYINAAYCGNVIRFLNHSSSPNCRFESIYLDGTCHVICVSIFFVLFCFVYGTRKICWN